MKQIPVGKRKVAFVDDEDYVVLSTMKWHLHKVRNHSYAFTKINKKHIFMHIFLINPPKGYKVDHKDGDGLNNQKINLRACTHQQNMFNRRIARRNKTGFKGVVRHRNQFRAQMTLNTIPILIGEFPTAKEAAIAYDQEAIKNHGEFARTNKSMGLLN